MGEGKRELAELLASHIERIQPTSIHGPGGTRFLYAEDRELLIGALRSASAASPEREENWRSDPAADERWSNGCDFALNQLCKVLDVWQDDVRWDAATETVDGDVQAVIGNIMRVKYGEDWDPKAATPPSHPAMSDLIAFIRQVAECEQSDNVNIRRAKELLATPTK